MNEAQGPASFEIKNFITAKKTVSFHLLNEKIIAGKISWNDNNCFHIQTEYGEEITLLKSAIAYYSAVN